MERGDYRLSSTSMVPTAMDRRLIVMPRPTSSMLSSIFNSSLNKASKMLISVATSEDATPGEGENWRAMDHVRHVLMLTIWANVWVLRALTNVFPSPRSNSGLHGFNVEALMSPKEQASSSALVVHSSQGTVNEVDLFSANSTAIGRTLSHVIKPSFLLSIILYMIIHDLRFCLILY
jgi:hypothetical protein